MAGKRVNFADLSDEDVLDVTPVDPAGPALKDALSAPLDWFASDPRNHRGKNKTDPELPSLARRMERFGQLQPVLVVSAELYRTRFPDVQVPATARFVIIAGNRRYAAAGLAKLESLYYLVNDGLLDADDYREAALDENIHRLDLTCVEVARTLGELLAEGDEETTHQALADQLDRSRQWVTQHLGLLNLPDEVLDLLDARRVALRQARPLAAWPKERIDELVERIRQAAGEEVDVLRPADTAVSKPAPKPKVAQRMLTSYRSHHGIEKFAELICDDLEPKAAATLATQVIGRLDDKGLDQVRALLAGPRAASE